jgi:glycosyltransferase involved in cell wall biosynthesis
MAVRVATCALQSDWGDGPVTGPRILIIVENLTLPLDRRVWQEATTLRDAGYTVSVICPVGGRHRVSYECLDGIHIFRHPLPFEASGALGYALEYSWALAWEFGLSLRVALTVGFDAIQACNPPDTIFLIGAFYKYLFGKPFVFDHHDINPELYEAKFGKRGFFHRLLTKLERWTFKTADVVISTNDNFKRIATLRGGMDPDRVFVVRSIPDLDRFRRTAPDPSLKAGRKTLVGYVGIMGQQDGVDLLVQAMHHIVHGKGRNDVHCAIVGSGTELERLKVQAKLLAVDGHITFTGFQSGQPLLSALSTFDVGVIPDPKNVYNDKISMNKVFEYMSLGIPFVQFDLEEGRRVAADAAIYAKDNDPADLAAKILLVADHANLRERMRANGLARAKSELSWDRERAELLAAWQLAFAGKRVPAQTPAQLSADAPRHEA